jgi:hypothetical protein
MISIAWLQRPLIVLPLILLLATFMGCGFYRDYQQIKAGRPFRRMGTDIYPDDPLYEITKFRWLGPYYFFFGVLTVTLVFWLVVKLAG